MVAIGLLPFRPAERESVLGDGAHGILHRKAKVVFSPYSVGSKLSFPKISGACVKACLIRGFVLPKIGFYEDFRLLRQKLLDVTQHISMLLPKISATCKLGMAVTGKARQKKPHADGRAMRTGRRMRQRGWKVKAVVGQPAWPQCGAYSWAHSISWHTLRPTHWLHPQDCGSRADPDPCDRRR